MILEENVLKNDFLKNIKFEYFLSLNFVFLFVFWFNMVIKNSLSGRFKLTFSAYKVYPSSMITCVILKYAFFQRTILHLLQCTTPCCVDSWSFKSVVPFVWYLQNQQWNCCLCTLVSMGVSSATCPFPPGFLQFLDTVLTLINVFQHKPWTLVNKLFCNLRMSNCRHSQ